MVGECGHREPAEARADDDRGARHLLGRIRVAERVALAEPVDADERAGIEPGLAARDRERNGARGDRGDRAGDELPDAHHGHGTSACAGDHGRGKLAWSMLTFSADPDVAEQQMNAIIFYLTAFGYIDGNFDFTEKTFVRIYIRQLVSARAKAAMPDADPDTRNDVISRFVAHFLEVFEQIDRSVKELFDEAVADGEDVEKFVYAKLKLRSYEIFQGFDAANQHELLTCVDELIYADGSVHPAEAAFRQELAALPGRPRLDLRRRQRPPGRGGVPPGARGAARHHDVARYPGHRDRARVEPRRDRGPGVAAAAARGSPA